MNRSLALLALSCVTLSLSAQTKPEPKAKAKATKPAAAAPKAPTVPAETPKAEVKPIKVGDAAPAFKVGRWVKGAPVTELKKGQIYVVEFWATWCPPCKDSIPHLTELSKKLAGKVTFIGVDVWERGNDEAAIDKKVDEFVKEFGDKMDYNVCRDGADKHMVKAWMEAAKQRGIPAAFIVDKAGTIAFIGNPHPGSKAFEEALEKIVAGTWDVKAAIAAAEKEAAEEKVEEDKAKARQAAWKEVSPEIMAATKAKDWAKVLTLADAAQAKYPDLKANLKRSRFLALAATDAAKAQALVDADLVKPDMPAYMNTATILLGEKGLDKRWSELALTCIDKALTLEPKLAPRVAGLRFTALLRTDAAKAKAAFEEAKGKPAATDLAASLLQEEGVEKPLMEAALTTLEEALKDPKASPMLNQTYAEGCFKLGQAAKAAAAQEKFFTFAKGAGAPPPMLAEIEETLKKYQGAAK